MGDHEFPLDVEQAGIELVAPTEGYEALSRIDCTEDEYKERGRPVHSNTR